MSSVELTNVGLALASTGFPPVIPGAVGPRIILGQKTKQDMLTDPHYRALRDRASEALSARAAQRLQDKTQERMKAQTTDRKEKRTEKLERGRRAANRGRRAEEARLQHDIAVAMRESLRQEGRDSPDLTVVATPLVLH